MGGYPVSQGDLTVALFSVMKGIVAIAGFGLRGFALRSGKFTVRLQVHNISQL
jgi:hypothetical protein